MNLGTMLYKNLKDVTWSSTSLPLDQLVSAYKLPQIVKLESGQLVEGLRDNDYLLIHSCRQWTTITAHSLEEGHYVIGPKIEIPVHYEGQFKLLEQDRDVKEPVQYFNSVEEVAKAFPERVYVMEEITFNVKMASGQCNEDTEVYSITLSTGDELTLMGQAEILYAKSSKEKSRLNTIFKKIGKLNSISKLGRGKMPCLICMNHRTNESLSLPFQCKGRFSTCSPLELQMQDGEHTIRNIVEKTRLPVNVVVPSAPPRNQHDLHLIREGHRYKLVNVQTKTVVVCCVLRSSSIVPVHFPFHVAMPRFIVPEELLQGELWLDTMVHRWFSFCQEQFDIDDYSRAVRDVRTDWSDDGKSPKKISCKGNCSGNNGCPNHVQVPSSLTYAREELTQSFHRLSVCVYSSNLHGNSEVNLQGCMTLCPDWAPLGPDGSYSEPGENRHSFPEQLDGSAQHPYMNRLDVQYEEVWTDHLTGRSSPTEGTRDVIDDYAAPAVLSYPLTCPLGDITSLDVPLTPPPVPPKSEAVKEECRLLNAAPPVPPRSMKQLPSVTLMKPQQQQDARSQSPTLSYYSSGLHNIGACEQEGGDLPEQCHACYPCPWGGSNTEPRAVSPCGDLLLSDSVSSRLSWPNNFSGGDSRRAEEFQPPSSRSYYSYPRKRTPGAPRTCTSCLVDYDGREHAVCRDDGFQKPNQMCTKSSSCHSEMYRDKPIEESNTKQSLSCPSLPPRTPKPNATKTCADLLPENLPDTRQDAGTPSPPPDSTSPSASPPAEWQPPLNLAGVSIEEVSKSLKFIGLPEDIVGLFVSEKIDGNLLLQLTEEILSEDFRLSKLQVKKLVQFINGWRPRI
ncbi:GRB2-associated and regulator of MAPK protein 1 [Austrofundulus limnaeus]|uniref:GRB2-associated and regulator of MAPK protein 1 n=1 Tax=Austrofundulus limnaeus TaxID=52670 RepID=A0A2I4B6C4_AUSLI|nr:PREDICTED: GRB2-associated and regulator of MAPK protein [Austrofundulus limnaeus]